MVAPSTSVESSGTWLGIDGATDADLIQTGTAQNSGPGGGYNAWVEVLPNASIDIGTVNPGDEMYAYIVETSSGDWTIFTEDVTLGESATNDVTGYYPPGASAEWIEEAPSLNGSQTILADFGTAQFTNMAITLSGTATLTPVEMADAAGTVLAYPSAYDSTNSSFTVTYVQPPPTVITVSPSQGSTAGGTSVTISGNNLNGATAVDFGGNPASFSVDSAATITATSPAGPAGTANITVTTPAGASSVSSADEFTYVAPPAPPPVPPPGPAQSSGYDLVGHDGGVFVFPVGQSGGFYGSLPGLGVKVSNIVGMVPTANDQGYFLVGSDGGVFAFGNAPFENSLPGIGVHVSNIVGIVPTSNDQGYFVVGSDGGVFTFGNAPFLGSLPSIGVHVNNIIGIAANPSDTGYWLVAANGTVYSFGSAPNLGSAPGTASPVSAIESTPDGGGYWIVTQNGSVYTFGDAGSFGSLPGIGVSPAHPVIGLVPTSDDAGYWLIGSDGGIFAFGDAPFVGSLPQVGVSVDRYRGSGADEALTDRRENGHDHSGGAPNRLVCGRGLPGLGDTQLFASDRHQECSQPMA